MKASNKYNANQVLPLKEGQNLNMGMTDNLLNPIQHKSAKLFLSMYNIKYTLMRSALLWLFVLTSFVAATAQVTVTTNGSSGLAASYPSLAAAVTALNGATITSPVVLTVPAGGAETAPAGGYNLTATGTVANTITIVKAAGAATVITAPAGTSAVNNTGTIDGIFRLIGSDYVTIDGLSFSEAAGNTAATGWMEFGVGLFKASATNGCQNNTIQNCIITLNRNNITAGTATNTRAGSTGILACNTLFTSVQTNITVTAASGSNSNNRFYTNTVQNCNVGMNLFGFVDVSPFNFVDTGNDVGGSSLTTANSFLNYGGGAATEAAGIITNNQYTCNISYNTFNNNNGSGVSVSGATSIRGVWHGGSLSASATITNNTITLASTGTGGMLGIDNSAGGTPASNTISINNNTILNCTRTSTATFVGIFNGANCANLNINNNVIRGITTSATTGATTGIQQGGGVGASVNINNNQLGNSTSGFVTFSAAHSSTLTGITSTATLVAGCTININNNNFQGITHTVGGSATHTYITLSGVTNANCVQNINGNTFTNLTVNTTGGVTFITQSYAAAATSTKNTNNNSIVTGFSKTGVGGTVTFILDNGSSVTGAQSNCLNNNFSNATVTGATTLNGISYTDGGTAPTRTVTGNTISNITAGTSAVNCMNFTYWNGVSSLSNNTVTNVTGQGSVTGVTIGAVVNTATSVLISNNNINTLSSTGTGAAVTGLVCTNTSTAINITGNTIHTLSSTGAASVDGIRIGGAATTNVQKNLIRNLSSSSTGGSVNGVNVTAGTTVNVFNNFVSDFRAPAVNANNPIHGINIAGGTTVRAIYNTIALGQGATITSTGTNFGATGIAYSSTAATEISNNIINVNATAIGTGLVAAIRRSATGTLGTAPAVTNLAATSNNNILYVNPAAQNFLYVEGGTFNATGGINNGYATSGITAVPGQNLALDAAFNTSCGLFKVFMSTNSGGARGSATFTENNLTAGSPTGTFAPSGASYAENGAYVPSTPTITDDYDGTARTAGTNNDAGARQFSGIGTDAAAPVIAYTAIPNPACGPAVVTLSATITDASGVNTTTGTKPRIWYKLSTEANAYGSYPTDNTSAFNGWKYVEASNTSSPYTFTIDNSLLTTAPVAGSTVQYFVVAQDNAGTTNVSVNGVTFATGSCPASVALDASLFGAGFGSSRSYTISTSPTVSAVAVPSTVCAGSPVTLSAITTSSGTAILGSGATTTSSLGASPFYHTYGGQKAQYIILASELTAAGIFPGNISSISVNITTLGTTTLNGFFIDMGHTAQASAIANSAITGLTNVYSNASQPLTLGINTFNITPFNWNGTSNIVISTSYSNNNTGGTSSTVSADVLGFTSSLGIAADNATSAAVYAAASSTGLGSVSTNGTSTTRPRFTFNASIAQAGYSYAWSSGGTGTPLVVNPMTNTSYTVTATLGVCSFASAPVAVTTISLPSAPTATNSAQCGSAIPTASVTSTSGAGTTPFYWYSAASGGTLLQTPPVVLQTYYTNNFSGSAAPATISGNASITGGVLQLHPNAGSQLGGITVPANGVNSVQYQVDFDVTTSGTAGNMADGFSYSFGNDVSATATTPSAEVGSGTKLMIGFDAYGAMPNGQGIYLLYAPSTYVLPAAPAPANGYYAYSANTAWVNNPNVHITISINAAGQVNVSVGGTAVMTNIQLPAAYLSANHSNWAHVIKGRTGGLSMLTSLDNLQIQTGTYSTGYSTWQNSVSTTTTYYVSESDGTCESLRTPVTVTVNAPDAITATAAPTSVCLGGSSTISVAQTGSTNTYNYVWAASPVSGSGLLTGGTGTSIPVLPTTAGSYTYNVTATDSGAGCVTVTSATVVINALPSSPVATITPSTICSGSSVAVAASGVGQQPYIMNSNSGVAFINISGTGTSVGTLADDSEHNITLPSAFVFNDIPYTTARVGNNGAVVFGSTTGDITHINTALPTTFAAGTPALVVNWDDMTPSGTVTTSITTQQVGNIFIIQWTDEDNFNATGTGTITFQAQLNLSTYAITYVYPDIVYGAAGFDNGASATVGLNFTATSASQYSFNTASLTNGQSITFTPSNNTYAWSSTPTGFTASTSNATASPTVNTNYTIVVTNAAGCTISASTPVVTVNPLPTTPSGVNASQCGAGIPTVSVASTYGTVNPAFMWYGVASGGTPVQYPGFGGLQTYYTNDFSGSVSPATISGNASVTGGVLQLHPNTTSQLGGITVPAAGYNSNQYQIEFDVTTSGTAGNMADGFSYSFGDDVSATAATPSAEVGSGTKLMIGFDAYGAMPNGQGIYLLYAPSSYTLPATPAPASGYYAYSSDVSWVNASNVHISIRIDALGQVTVLVGGTPVMSGIQLPTAYLSANRSNWAHVIKGRTGGISMLTQIDNLLIQNNQYSDGYTTYLSSISAAQTFYVSEYNVTTGCESPRVTVNAAFVTAPVLTLTPSTSVCSYDVTRLRVTSPLSDYNTYVWTPVTSLYSDNAATTAYALNTNATSVYHSSNTAGAQVYTCSATNTSNGCVNTATTTVTTLPASIVATASAMAVCVSGTVDLSTPVVTGGTIRWQTSPDGVNSWADIAGATSNTYTTPTISSTSYYRAVLSRAVGFDCAISNTLEINANNPAVTATTPGSICGVGTAQLGATGNGTLNWYAAATGGVSLGAGTTFNTPVISTTTTYYVEAQQGGTTNTVGVPDNNASYGTFGSPGGTGYGLYFTTSSALTISTVYVYPQAAGTSTIQLQDGTGTLIAGQTVTVTFTAADVNARTLVSLGFTVPGAGSYRLMNTAGISLGRFNTYTGTAYPLTYGPVTLTQGSGGVATYYSFFSWVVTTTCFSARTAVTATVTTPPTLVLTSATAICQNTSTSLSASGGTYNSFTWSPATGLSSTTGTSVTASPTANQTYAVTATDGTCIATGTVAVTVSPAPSAPAVTPASVQAVCVGGNQPLTAVFNGTGSVFTELFDATPTAQFTLNSVTGTYTATQNATYFTQGTSSALLTTASTSATGNLSLTSNLNLLNYSSAQLTFSHIAALEGPTTSYDYGFVEYSADGGTTWTTFPTTSYVGTASNLVVGSTQFSTRSYANWISAFTSSASVPNNTLWHNETFNIPAAALTSQFRVRFRYTTDVTTSYYGWLIDNVAITGTPLTSQYAWSATPAIGAGLPVAATTPAVGNTSIVVAPTANGTYTYSAYSVTGAGCYSAPTKVIINTNGQPTALAGASINACGSCTPVITLTGAVSGAATGATWSTSGGGTLSSTTWNAAGVTYTPSGADLVGAFPKTITMTLTPTASAGCTPVQSALNVILMEYPNLTVPASAQVCFGSTLDLTSVVTDANNVTGGPIVFYSTQADAQNQTNALGTSVVNPTVNTTYWARKNTPLISDLNARPNCKDIESVPVTVNPVPTAPGITPVLSSSICPATPLNFTLTGTVPADSYTWSAGVTALYLNGTLTNPYLTGTDTNSIYSAPLNNTTYTVTATNSFNCTTTVSQMAQVRTAATQVLLAPTSVNSLLLPVDCTDNSWTYYADPADVNKWYFAINWNPDGGTEDNAAQRAAAQITLGVREPVVGTPPTAFAPTFNPGSGGYGWYESVDPSTSQGTFTMQRYWNVNVGGGALAEPVKVRFFFDSQEYAAAENAATAWSLANGGYLEGPKWFKTTTAPDGLNNSWNPGSDLDPVTVEHSGWVMDLAPNVFGYGYENTTTPVRYVQFDNITSFSGGTLAFGVGNGNALPLELLYFTGTKDNGVSRLSWATAQEQNTSHFVVERSRDAVNFTPIGQVTAAGNSTQELTYGFDDVNPMSGDNYYRLRVVDFDNTFNYSNIINLNYTVNFGAEVYPNPFQSSFTVDIFTEQAVSNEATIELYDIVGRVVQTGSVTINSGRNSFTLNNASLTPGTYMLKITSGNNTVIRKIVKNEQ